MTREPERRLWWFPEVKETLAFLLGCFILIYETVLAAEVQVILVISAVAMMGVLGSGVAQRALKKMLEE